MRDNYTMKLRKKHGLFFLVSLFFSLSLFAQSTYSRVNIQLDKRHTIAGLAQMGLDVDHGQYIKNRSFIGEFSEIEIDQIKTAGYSVKVLQADLQQYFLEQNKTFLAKGGVKSSSFCNDELEYPSPSNFQLGSMGGYFTYQEMMEVLDEMQAKYPHLISTKGKVGKTTTHENRQLYYVTISDNPMAMEGEPEVLYTAVHHAREPASMSQLIYYMWYILENYDKDPEIKYLVDNTKMYFIPCVNPDGYLYNESTHPEGGGYWRKNRRPHQFPSSVGVDLNRNYGYEWGHDDIGSSADVKSSVYRGPAAFSEPETQAIRDFCLMHDFQLAFNHHAFGNILIYPWGYEDTPTEDHDIFTSFGDVMTSHNHFSTGTGKETIGYHLNGHADDWMYGEQSQKDKIYAYTCEVGSGHLGFYPPMSEIEGLCQSMLWQNLMLPRLVHAFATVEDRSALNIASQSGSIAYTVERHGMEDANYMVVLRGISTNVAETGMPRSYTLDRGEKVDDAITFQLENNVQVGEPILFELMISNGAYVRKDTIRKFYGGQANAFLDMGSDLTNWTKSGYWDSAEDAFYSSPAAITDSPGGDYSVYSRHILTQTEEITLPSEQPCFIQYRAKWDIEPDVDYLQVLLSVNGSVYQPVCGKHTSSGTGRFQPADEPLYDGIQEDWVLEQIDLAPYVAGFEDPTIRLRFEFVSDGSVQGDGFYLDDLQIFTISEAPAVALEAINLQAQILDNQKVELDWKVRDNSDFGTLNLERADENGKFIKIAEDLDANDILIDSPPFLGQNYYRLQYTDENGFMTYSSVITVTLTGELLNIYPNPIKDKLHVNWQLETLPSYQLQIFRADGQLLFEQEQVNSEVDLNLEDLGAAKAGIYLLRLQSGDRVITRKLVKL